MFIFLSNCKVLVIQNLLLNDGVLKRCKVRQQTAERIVGGYCQNPSIMFLVSENYPSSISFQFMLNAKHPTSIFVHFLIQS